MSVSSIPSNAPRCLAPFRVTPVSRVDAGLPIDVDFNSYALTCPCGHSIWRVHGYWFDDTSELDDPIAIECQNCHAIRDLLDTRTDGYDAEIGDVPSDPAGGSKVIWTCPRCSLQVGKLIASFGYQYEQDNDTARPEDLFDAVVITHICLNSKDVVQVCMFECA